MLSDEVASKVLGELHTLTKHLDEQSKQVINSASIVKRSADLIKQNSDEAVKNARKTADLAQLESAASFQIQFSKVAATALNEVADAVATKAAMRWVVVGLVIASVLTVYAGVVGYNKGKDAGGAVAAWAASKDGEAARKLSAVQPISTFLECSGKGWEIKKRETGTFCFPLAAADDHATYGWRIR